MTSISSSLFAYSSSSVSKSSSSDQSLLDMLDKQQQTGSGDNVFGGAYSINLSGAAFSAMNGDSSSIDSSSGSDIMSALSYSSNSSGASGSSSFEMMMASLTTTTSTDSSSDASSADDSSADGSGIDQLLKFVQDVFASNEDALEQIGNTSSSSSSNTSNTSAASANAASTATDSTGALTTASDGESVADIMNSGGPLPQFLQMVDARMHLSTTQATALQNIAMENMSATKSTDSVATINSELQAAGLA